MPKCVDCFARPCGRPRVTSRLVPACPERRSARAELDSSPIRRSASGSSAKRHRDRQLHTAKQLLARLWYRAKVHWRGHPTMATYPILHQPSER